MHNAGNYNKGSHDLSNMWGGRSAILLRVINNEVYYDWPWGIERYESEKPHYTFLLTDHLAILEMVLRTVSDLGDSVFLFGGEQAFLPWNVPFPSFSFAPSIGNAEFPFPWKESYALEADYEREAQRRQDHTDRYFKAGQTPWKDRKEKAAFFASIQSTRQVVYDSAALRPDLFEVNFIPNNRIEPWNPLSDEPQSKQALHYIYFIAFIFLLFLYVPFGSFNFLL